MTDEINYIHVTKAVIIQNSKILLLKRKDSSKFFPKAWDFAGGKVEPGETVEQAVVREVKEETGLDVIPEKIVGEFPFEASGKQVMFHVFEIRPIDHDISDSIVLSADHSEFIWVEKNDLMKLDLAPAVRKYFEV